MRSSRYIFIWSIVIILSHVLTAQKNPGINFSTDDWESVLSLSSATNRPIFVDAYTSWCQACKQMDKVVFPQRSVGDAFNDHYINVRMDMEAGLGPMLALQYDVSVFPSFLFIAPDGTLLHAISGYQNAVSMIRHSRRALLPESGIAAREMRYKKGARQPDFLYNYLIQLIDRNDPRHILVVDEYFVALKNRYALRDLRLIFQFIDDAHDPKYDFLINHRDDFIAAMDSTTVHNRIVTLFESKLNDPSVSMDEERTKSLFVKVYPADGMQRYMAYIMNEYLVSEKYTDYALTAIKYVDQYGANDAQKKAIMMQFDCHISDPAILEVAIEWSKAILDKRPTYEHLLRHSSLYTKIPNKRKAKRYTRKALKKGKKENIDISAAVEMMNRIKNL